MRSSCCTASPDGELGHILVEWIVDRPLTWRDHVMLAQRFAAHLNAYADDVEEKCLRRHAGPQRRGRGRNLVRR